MKQSYHLTLQSFSLIEVIVFIGILSMFFVTSMAVVIYSLQNMKMNEHKIVAVQYAQQLSSWLKAQKDSNWNLFVGHGGYSYCFNTAPINLSWPSPKLAEPFCTASDPPSLNSLYNRWVTLTNSGSPTDRVDIDIKISWNELGRTNTVPIHTSFSRFE